MELHRRRNRRLHRRRNRRGRRGSADGGAADEGRRGAKSTGSLFVFNDTMILKDCPSNDVLLEQEPPNMRDQRERPKHFQTH